MPGLVPDEGEREFLRKCFKVDEDVYLRLFKNNITPSEGDSVATYIEATFTGYSQKTLAKASWGTPATVGGTSSITYGSAQTWTSSDPTAQAIYGYYIVGVTSGILLFAERFGTARNINNGETITFTPRVEAA